jgi:hypothetical protein
LPCFPAFFSNLAPITFSLGQLKGPVFLLHQALYVHLNVGVFGSNSIHKSKFLILDNVTKGAKKYTVASFLYQLGMRAPERQNILDGIERQ